ncbi:GNAT family N-acetyltransferase [Streptomyces tateyamensis]|uniref:GNAT family N-acetyltransferase n=1 Tax=Streptomyces tateyamensis TaxID=565073 RepID=A0A2V4NHF4_9ACTN|nr:GNAT family N-acetyltransferase [Streptomyces tateyamensis]PYC66661.1 GNAT family N-acetyltransferase [Streptomyces tateyamensis]
MTWTFSESVAEFQQHAGEYLRGRPVENTVLLTLTHQLAAGGAAGGDPALGPRFGWWRPGPGEPVAGACLQTPPQPIRLGTMPPAAAVQLADTLPWPELAGAGGPADRTRAFAQRWSERTGAAVTVNQEQRLFRLGGLTAPTEVPGRLRRGTEADAELLVDWFARFASAVDFAPRDVPGIIARRLGSDDLHLWEYPAGRPVSMAGLSPVLAGMTRIGPVYTPEDQRGRGYASAVTAAVSALGRERGAREVLLFTDLANPTSNSIYQKLGYRPVDDSVILDFRRA